ncbi:MAG: hypothetical protein WDA24_05365 [Tissierellales bacterium]
MNVEILERLESKRNQVYKVMLQVNLNSKLAILKKYSPNNLKFLDIEYKNIHMLKELGILVPEIIHKDKDSLIMEYVEGELVVDLVERLDNGDWIDKLALWLSELHKNSKENGSLLKKDVNLRNFIYRDGQIYGLDFEEIDYGDLRLDLGNICFFILTNEPAFKKEKHIMMKHFLKSYERYSKKEIKDIDSFLFLAKIEAEKRRKV